MILHMLGGGPAQAGIIRRARELGHRIIVSDRNLQAPGVLLADFPSGASSFDSREVLADARKFGAQALMTAGTDQPVLTAARVSQQRNLPYFLSVDQALMVTNKKVMKQAMAQEGIPTMKFTFLKKGFREEELAGLRFPLVIKPLDSQGQRGVLKVASPEEIRNSIDLVLSFSREEEILAEEYYPSVELTISGWVEEGRSHILSLTDRVTVDNGPHLGVCLSHRYPSVREHDAKALEVLTQELTRMIGLERGPLYFQILHGEKGYIVNEIACRLGGAYEDEFIPWLCRVPLRDLMIEMTSREGYNAECLREVPSRKKGKFLSVQMFFCRPGIIDTQIGMDQVLTREGILSGSFLLINGTQIVCRQNSTQRAGYFIASGTSAEELNCRIRDAYRSLSITGTDGAEMIQFDRRMLFPDEQNM